MKININGQEVFCGTGGKDFDSQQPSIIFIHGTALDNTVWTLYARYYARRGYNVFTVDLPGHGHSEGKPLETIESISEWLNSFMDEVGIKQASLVGHSMGALVAIDMALNYSQRVSKIALLGVSVPMPVGEPFLQAAKDNKQSAIDMFLLYGIGYAAQMGGNPISGINIMNASKRLVERAGDGVMYAGLNACNQYQLDEPQLKSLKCETHIIMGKDDSMTPLKAAKDLAKLLQNVGVTEISDCGHMSIVEKPEEVHAALLEVFI